MLIGPTVIGGRVRVVEADVRAVDLEDDLERDLVVGDPVVVHHAVPDVAAVGELLEVAPDDRLAVVEHPLDRLLEGRKPEALDDAEEARRARCGRSRPRR